MTLGIFLQIRLLANPLLLIINIVALVLVILMTIGVAKRKKFGIVAGWSFEACLLVILGLSTGLGLTELIIAIWLPFDFCLFSKALKEI